MAILYHYCSTNEKPRHENCPPGAESWCEWRKTEARGEEKNYNHPSLIITSDVGKHLLPIYQGLSKEELLTRCLGGKTLTKVLILRSGVSFQSIEFRSKSYRNCRFHCCRYLQRRILLF